MEKRVTRLIFFIFTNILDNATTYDDVINDIENYNNYVTTLKNKMGSAMARAVASASTMASHVVPAGCLTRCR
jgi:hypothetical protein